ncbi:MAG: hypothetical protein AB1422_07005, partial [bacterium]
EGMKKKLIKSGGVILILLILLEGCFYDQCSEGGSEREKEIKITEFTIPWAIKKMRLVGVTPIIIKKF